MKTHHPMPFRFVLPLPSFVLSPLTAAVIATVHVYLAAGHLWQLIAGDVQWTHCWKGFGALAGVYVCRCARVARLRPHAIALSCR